MYKLKTVLGMATQIRNDCIPSSHYKICHEHASKCNIVRWGLDLSNPFLFTLKVHFCCIWSTVIIINCYFKCCCYRELFKWSFLSNNMPKRIVVNRKFYCKSWFRSKRMQNIKALVMNGFDIAVTTNSKEFFVND